MEKTAKKEEFSIVKTTLLALTVAFAIAFSAFKNQVAEVTVPKAVKGGAITADYIIQPTDNNFVQSTSTPNPTLCGTEADLHCIYNVTASGKANIPNQGSYTAEQINTYVDNGWLVANENSERALYNN